MMSRIAIVAVLSLILGPDLSPADEPAREKSHPRVAHSDGAIPPQATFDKFPDWVACVAFSPDSRWLAAGSYGVIKLYDVAEMREVGSLEEPAGFVRSLAFSADGKTLAAGTYQAATLWNVADRRAMSSFKGHRGYVTGVAFLADGGKLVTASDDESLRFWETSTGQQTSHVNDLGQPALALAAAPDGQALAVATGDVTRPTKKGTVFVFDASGTARYSLQDHLRAVGVVAFSPDGATLASGSVDESIRLYDAAEGKERMVLEGHARPVNGLAYLPDGKWLLSASGGRNVGGNEIKLWDIATGKDRVTIAAHEAPVVGVAVSPDGAWAATASIDKSVQLWSMAALLGAAGTEAAANDDAPKAAVAEGAAPPVKEVLRAGMIGLDTSHCIAFTKMLNAKSPAAEVAGCRIVAAYPPGSPDIESSVSRVPMYTKQMREMGVEIVDSIADLLEKVDVVLLETNDGRPHLEQALPVLRAKKPLFIDKPLAGSLADAVALFEAARREQTPIFTASQMRFGEAAQAIRAGKIGAVKGCDAFGPCPLEATHPDFFWYGIHGVEALYTCMGTGCTTVTRFSSPTVDVIVGQWPAGRIGTVRGNRNDKGDSANGYGGTAFGTDGVALLCEPGRVPPDTYPRIMEQVVRFFRTGVSPVPPDEMLEIYTFMEAADESKRTGGKPVNLADVLAKAQAEVRSRKSP